MPVTIQVTLGSAPKQISVKGINFKQMIVQVNGTNPIRLGDSTIVAGAYGVGKGILLTPGSSYNGGALPIQAGILSGWYLAGTAADVVDVTYEPA